MKKYTVKDISYTGWFVMDETVSFGLKSFSEQSFPQIPNVFHVTHLFSPKKVDFSLFNQTVTVVPHGYAKTEKCEAIAVFPLCGKDSNKEKISLERLTELFSQTENTAHISLRKADDSVKWFHCGKLNFKYSAIPQLFYKLPITTVYGAYMKDGSVVTDASLFE